MIRNLDPQAIYYKHVSYKKHVNRQAEDHDGLFTHSYPELFTFAANSLTRTGVSAKYIPMRISFLLYSFSWKKACNGKWIVYEGTCSDISIPMRYRGPRFFLCVIRSLYIFI